MRKSKFRDDQMVAILREADRDPLAVVAKRHGISEQTIYVWRRRFGTLQSDDVLNAATGNGRKHSSTHARTQRSTGWRA